MCSTIKITGVHFRGADDSEVERGLLGWVSFCVNSTFRLDGCTLRRTTEGRLALSFPSRRDGRGQKHPLIRPLNDAARRDIERQVFQALGLEEEARR